MRIMRIMRACAWACVRMRATHPPRAPYLSMYNLHSRTADNFLELGYRERYAYVRARVYIYMGKISWGKILGLGCLELRERWKSG